MPVLAGRRIFTVAGTSYAWEDLVLAGCLWGDWPALEARARDGLACLARLDELDEDDEDALAEEDVETAATEFRYARDLVAASGLESWLDRVGRRWTGGSTTSVARSCSSAGPRTSSRSARKANRTRAAKRDLPATRKVAGVKGGADAPRSATVALPYIEKKSGVVASGHIKVFDGAA
jgi:hypothetical protein